MSWRGIVAGLVLAAVVLGARSALPPGGTDPPIVGTGAAARAYLEGGR